MADTRLKALLVDDDEDVRAMLAYYLAEIVPDLNLHYRARPEVEADHDLYLIDNDFGGRQVGADLVTRARELSPNSLVVAYSSKLDRDLLKKLINASCDGAFDKADPEDVKEMLRLIEGFVAQLQRERRGRSDGPVEMLREMGQLFRSWDQRLSKEENSAMQTSRAK
jgi:DNA-binding NarL/FixJ family response regulator